MRKNRLTPLLIFLLCSVLVNAQSANSQPVEMADGMRSNGKIYVVVGVLVLILFGLLTYLISIDRKVGRIEKNIEESNKK